MKHHPATMFDLISFQLPTKANAKSLPRLHQATLRGNAPLLEELLEAGEDPNNTDTCGRQPIWLATVQNHPAALMVLLSHGANVDPGASSGKPSPLHVAVANSFTEVAAMLLRYGADVNRGNKNGLRCVHCIAGNTTADTMRLLINAKANLEAKNQTGRTCLHFAAQTGNAAVARLVLEAGADTAPESLEGATPLHCAAERGEIGGRGGVRWAWDVCVWDGSGRDGELVYDVQYRQYVVADDLWCLVGMLCVQCTAVN